ncbi:MAG TPA: recombinase family protein, partial [Rhodothermia bacterium]|nr:recombinase family protein [Rhodothermia bacterium]
PGRTAVMYVRVSSKEQEQGFSIPAQRQLLHEYAQREGIHVVQEFEDVETAKRAGRSSFGEMVAFLREKSSSCRILLVEKTDRLYRNIKDWVTIDELNIEVHFVKENVVLSEDSRSSEKFMHGIKVLMAKNYIDNLGEEVRKGMIEKARQGHWPTVAPVGYQNNLATHRIEPDPERAPIIAKLFEWYASGEYSLKALTRKAAAVGLTNRTGGTPLVKAKIHQLLQNPIYHGEFYWLGQLHQGLHKPIISRDLFARVQDVFAAANHSKHTKRRHAFAGLITCGRCGCGTRELDAAVTAVSDAATVTESRLTTLSNDLAQRHAVQEADYRATIAASEEQGGRAAERAALQASLANAQIAATEQLAKEAQRQGLATARHELLKRGSELRDQRFALRKRIAERLTNQFPSIRVTVVQAAELERYRDLVADALKGAGVKQGVVAEKLAQTFLPGELAGLVAASDHTTLAQRTGFDEDRARKVVDTLKSSGTYYTIETVDLDDQPRIELLDGGTFKESTQLSTGQRCTTILPILLTQSERPLLIDQPEDNLDNAFVYDTIVTALRAVRGSRQVIFVTHNPNIPVLGEAERVFVFSSDGQRATLKQVGTVDECKDQVERILEGGREAFLQRKARYGH